MDEVKNFSFGRYIIGKEAFTGLIHWTKCFGVFNGLPKNVEKAEPSLTKKNGEWLLKIDEFYYSLNYLAKGMSLVEQLVDLGKYEFYKMKAVNRHNGNEEYLLVVHNAGYSIVIAPRVV